MFNCDDLKRLHFIFQLFRKKGVTFEIDKKASKIGTKRQENTWNMTEYKKLPIGVTNEMFRSQ